MMDFTFTSSGLARRSGPTLALLLLLAVLLPCACADTATMRRCKDKYEHRRLLEPPRDVSVTILNMIACKNISQSEFESDNFDGVALPNLEKIILSFNNLERLSPGIFSPFAAKLKVLKLDHNKLKEIPVCDVHSPLPQLEELKLNSNRISTLTDKTFVTCVKLEILVLDHNLIKYVHPTAFLPLTSLRRIDLDYNNLTSVSDTMFNIRTLKDVNLKYNLIEYISPSAFSGTKLTSLDLHGNRVSYLPAYFMSELNSAGGHLDYHYFARNPWHCACLLEHLADVKKAGVVLYAGWMYDGKEPMCVFLGNACHRHFPSSLLLPPRDGPNSQ